MNEKDKSTIRQVIAAINAIRDDNESGAAEILGRAAEVFSLLAGEQRLMNPADRESALRLVIETCARLALAQPDMAPLENLASEVGASASKATDAREVFESALDAARGFTRWAARAARLATSHAAGLVGDGATVFTHSRSSTVLAALSEARRAGKNFSVIATESRPALEGQRLAEAL
ncbi:MAG TPA: hypothetical protein VJZ26_07035, partial [Blastocatellia bacterium]|nr:hypothetical protein [Blastocatellia bacterium]